MPSTATEHVPSLRRRLHWAGSGLTVAGIVFVGFRLHAYWLDLEFSKITVAGLGADCLACWHLWRSQFGFSRWLGGICCSIVVPLKAA